MFKKIMAREAWEALRGGEGGAAFWALIDNIIYISIYILLRQKTFIATGYNW
jgi:hypothetical protein